MIRPTGLPGGVTLPGGFLAAGMACGIKPKGRPDLALLFSEVPCTAAGVFTRNRIQAASVRLTAGVIARGKMQAVLINSGNANACTGAQGAKDARAMAGWTAKALGLSPRTVAVASTGVIGKFLPMARIGRAIPSLTRRLRKSGGRAAASAILTTDTAVKEIGLRAELGGVTVSIGGMAKGAGMIHPRMATMLAFLTTDARINAPTLRRALREAVEESFNRISVDGETSTNDMVLVMANGRAQVEVPPRGRGYDTFTQLLHQACRELALKIVSDGEGATKRIGLSVQGARTRSDAIKVAEAVVRSPLVKTAFFGEDANWGRILAAVGAAGVAFDPDRLELSIGKVVVVRRGVGRGAGAEAAAAQQLKSKEIALTIRLGSGSASIRYWTCDLSPAYVRINSAYRS